MTQSRGWLVPDDWDGVSYATYTLCAPCSQQWEGIVTGAIYNLARARNWDADSGDFLAARDTGLEVYLSMANCNDGMVQMADAIREVARSLALSQGDCNCPGGTGTEYDGAAESAPTVFGPNEQFPTEQAYLDAKCQMANLMYQQYLELVQELNALDVDTLAAGVASLGISLVAGIIAALFATGPIGLTVGVVAGLVALFVGAPLFDLTDIVNQLQASKNALVCALYDAPNATVAKTNFEDEIKQGALTFFEGQFVDLIGVNNFYNQLFTIPDGYEVQTVESPVDCDICEGSLGVFYTQSVGGEDRGTGTLLTDGSPMSLQGALDPSNGFYYVSFGVYTANQDRKQNYASDCAILPVGASGTPSQSFEFVMTGLVRNPNSGTLGTQCINGVWGVEFNSSIVNNDPQDCTWIEYISSNPFTLDCTVVWPHP